MKLGFNLFGVNVTVVDTSVPTVEEAIEEEKIERWKELKRGNNCGDLDSEEEQEFYSLCREFSGWNGK